MTRIFNSILIAIVMAVTVVPNWADEAFGGEEEWQYSVEKPEGPCDELEEVTLYSYDDYAEDEYTKVYGEWKAEAPEGKYETQKVYLAFVSMCPCYSWFWLNTGGRHSNCRAGEPWDGEVDGVPYRTTSVGLYVYSSNDMAKFQNVEDEDNPNYWCAQLPGTISKEDPGEFGEIYAIKFNGEYVDEFVSGSNKDVTYLYRKKKATTDGSRATNKNQAIYRSYEVVFDDEKHAPNWSDWSDIKPAAADNRVIKETKGYKYIKREPYEFDIPDGIKMYVGDTLTLKDDQVNPRTYASTSSKTVAVSPEGVLTAKSVGTATIRIKAEAGNGYRAAAKSVRVTTALKPPELTAEQATSRSIKLSWSKSPGAAYYQIFRVKGSSNKFTKVATKNYKVSGTTNVRLSKGATYKYKVRAYKTVKGKRKYSAFSDVVMVKLR